MAVDVVLKYRYLYISRQAYLDKQNRNSNCELQFHGIYQAKYWTYTVYRQKSTVDRARVIY